MLLKMSYVIDNSSKCLGTGVVIGLASHTYKLCKSHEVSASYGYLEDRGG